MRNCRISMEIILSPLISLMVSSPIVILSPLPTSHFRLRHKQGLNFIRLHQMYEELFFSSMPKITHSYKFRILRYFSLIIWFQMPKHLISLHRFFARKVRLKHLVSLIPQRPSFKHLDFFSRLTKWNFLCEAMPLQRK